MMLKKKLALAAAVGATALSVQALPTPWLLVTYDNPTATWTSTRLGDLTLASPIKSDTQGNYSVNGKNAVGNFDTTRLGYGLWGASVWGTGTPGTTGFTIGLCFKTVADFGKIIFDLGSIDDTTKEILYVHSKSANEIGLSVVYGKKVLRSLTVPVADVTRYHAYVIRYTDGKASVEVDGVPVSGTLAWTSHTSGYIQILGAYAFFDKLSGYAPGCGTVHDNKNGTPWTVNPANHGNVVDDVRIWKSILSEAEGLEYAALFGDSTESLAGTTLVIEKGCLHAEYPDFKNATLVRKTTAGKALFDAVKTFPALAVEGGEVSFQNGLAETHKVTGALTLAGGTTLDLDVLASSCDALEPGSLDLSGASAANPITLKLRVANAVSSIQNLPLIKSGLVAGDEAKFALSMTGRVATLKVVNGALVLNLVTKPDILFTYDSQTSWTANEGSATLKYDGKYETGNFVEAKSGYGIRGASPWYSGMNIGKTKFTIGLCFKTVTSSGHIMLNVGSLTCGSEVLLVHSKSANEIGLSVAKSRKIQRTLLVPVADVTKYHTYVIHYNNGTASVEVDGVPVSGTLTWTWSNNDRLQILGGYDKQSTMSDYPHGYNNNGNVLDDMRIWSSRDPAADGQLLDYYWDFGIIDWSVNGTTFIARSGLFVQDAFIFSASSGFTRIVKMTDGTLRIGANTVFTLPVEVAEGALSFEDGAATTHTFAGLTLAGGAHLKVDVVAASADCLAPTALTLDGATAETPIVFDFKAAANANFNASPTLIASGLQPGDEAKFAYTGVAGEKLVFFVENGALKIRYNRGLKIFIR